MTYDNLPVTVKNRLKKIAKQLVELRGKESDIWKVRGKLLLEEREKLEHGSFETWCAKNNNFGVDQRTLRKQMVAVEFLNDDSNRALTPDLADDYDVISRVAGLVKKKGSDYVLKKIKEKKIEKVTQTTFKELVPKPAVKRLTGGVAKQCWKTPDFKFLRQQCHPDKHPEEEKEKWEKVWKLIEFAYKGEK